VRSVEKLTLKSSAVLAIECTSWRVRVALDRVPPIAVLP